MAVSAVMPRRSRTMSLMRGAGTRRALARAFAVRPAGRPILVVVNDLNVLRSRCGPAEADAPSVVDSDTVLTLAVALKRLESIAGRGTQELQCRRRLELCELPARSSRSRSQRLVQRAAAAGVDARLEVWEGIPHGFLGGVGQLEPAGSALSAIGEFLFSRLAPGS